MKNKKATQESIKEHNIGLILRNVKEKEQITRIKLSKETRLAKSTVSDLVNSLINQKVIFEDKKAESKIGKKPTILKFNKNYLSLVAVDIGIDNITVALVNSFGEITNKIKKKNYPRKNRNQILKNTFSAIDNLFKNSSISLERIYLFSIGTHGVVDPSSKTITHAPYLVNWNGIDLVKLFNKKYKKEIILENSVNLGAIGEQWRSLKDIDTLVYLDINHGIGAGIIINNKIVTGNRGTMGEISYLPILREYNISKLKENKFELGLFESQVDVCGIINKAKEKFIKLEKKSNLNFPKEINEINFATICNYYNDASDNFAKDIIKDLIDNDVIKVLAIGIASIISIIDTEVIVVNGDILKLGNKFMNKLKKETYAITPFKPKIVASKLKEDAHIEGAIKSGINHLNDLLYNHFLSLSKSSMRY